MSQKTDGCEYHPSCSACPEVICIFEFPGGAPAFFRYQEMKKILAEGADINRAALQMGVSLRTAQRIYNSGQRACQSA